MPCARGNSSGSRVKGPVTNPTIRAPAGQFNLPVLKGVGTVRSVMQDVASPPGRAKGVGYVGADRPAATASRGRPRAAGRGPAGRGFRLGHGLAGAGSGRPSRVPGGR